MEISVVEIDTDCFSINQFQFTFTVSFFPLPALHLHQPTKCVHCKHYRSSKSLLANVLDIDDDFRCNHRCNTLPHNPTYYRTVYRQGEDGSIGVGVGGTPGVGSRLHETVSHTCLSSSAEYELALILKELRVITDTVSFRIIFPPPHPLPLLWLHLFIISLSLFSLAINFMHYLTESEYFIASHFVGKERKK